MATQEHAERMVQQAAMVSQKVREALQASLPVAPEQLLTVQIPGTIIDTSETGPYYWNDREEPDTPHRVRVNESRLVDGMVPLSKIMMGPTGKSVARSYAAALDMLIPEDAPIDTDRSTATKTAAAERYTAAMKYLTGTEPGSSKSVIDVYVEKQQAYSDAMNEWDQAKQAARDEARKLYPGRIREQQRHYDDWNQESFRNFKNHAQAKYMDWIVNGNKYKVDYYFGIVDVSSAMKRVESSKEASRNLVVIDPDGSTEWQHVSLTPANWGAICKEKVDNWQAENNKLSRKDFESEIKRLNRLLLSYTGLRSSIDPHGKVPQTNGGDLNGIEGGDPAGQGTRGDANEVANTTLSEEERNLKDAFCKLYEAQAKNNLDEIRKCQNALQSALETTGKANLKKNKESAAELAKMSKDAKIRWIDGMISDTKSQIVLLEKELKNFALSSVASPAISDVVKSEVKEQGSEESTELISNKYSDPDDKWADARFQIPRNGVAVPAPSSQQPSKWTKISLSISASSEESNRSSVDSSSSASVSGGWGLWSASASANYSRAASQASASTANCSVDVKFEALLVTIDRAWLHSELFSDPELNTGEDVSLSPGALALHKYIDLKDEKALQNYPYFPSYPTAFIVAANVELEFRGDTTHLEEAMETSHLDAQVKVGYGPFSLSASHSQDNSSAKTKMETTSTGTRITLEAPAIIGWVSTLVPRLPRPRGDNALMGPLI